MWDQSDGSTWIQYVSQKECGRDEVRTLQQRLERKLKERQARERGICAVSEELYAQTYDELIREVRVSRMFRARGIPGGVRRESKHSGASCRLPWSAPSAGCCSCGCGTRRA
jgi:hypothetical protein